MPTRRCLVDLGVERFPGCLERLDQVLHFHHVHVLVDRVGMDQQRNAQLRD